MKTWEVFFSAGYKGVQDSVLVEAPDADWAEAVFEHYFPAKSKYIIAVSEFQHKPWMKSMEQLRVYKDPYPELHEIDWSQITPNDVANAIGRAFHKVLG